MRRAWNVRLAGLPPVRRAAAGIDSRISSTSRADVVNGCTFRSTTTRAAIRLANFSSPYWRRIRARSRGGVGVEDVGGGGAGRRVHAHVEGRVLRVGEAAVRLVELHRGDAEVEEDALDLVVAEVGEDVGQLVVHRVHERGPLAERGEPLAGQAQGLGVAVEARRGAGPGRR